MCLISDFVAYRLLYSCLEVSLPASLLTVASLCETELRQHSLVN